MDGAYPEMRHDIHVHDAFDVRRGTLLKRHQRHNSCIIDEDVHSAQIPLYVRVQLDHFIVLADVGLIERSIELKPTNLQNCTSSSLAHFIRKRLLAH